MGFSAVVEPTVGELSDDILGFAEKVDADDTGAKTMSRVELVNSRARLPAVESRARTEPRSCRRAGGTASGLRRLPCCRQRATCHD